MKTDTSNTIIVLQERIVTLKTEIDKQELYSKVGIFYSTKFLKQ